MNKKIKKAYRMWESEVVISVFFSLVFFIFVVFQGTSPFIFWLDKHLLFWLISTSLIWMFFRLTRKKRMKLVYESNNQILKHSVRFFYNSILIYYTAVLCMFLLILFQFQFNIDESTVWLQNHISQFNLSIIFFMIVSLFLYSIIGELYKSLIAISILSFIMGFIHFNKLLVLYQPFYPTDFLQVTHMKDVIPMLVSVFSVKRVLALILSLIIISLFIYIVPKQKLKIKSRLSIAVISMFLIISFVNYQNSFLKSFVEQRAFNMPWNQVENYKQNGFLLGFVFNMDFKIMPEPDKYDMQTIKQVSDSILNIESEVSAAEKSPHVVFLMSEAFWDPTRMKKVEFNEDPIPNIRQYMQDYSSGYALSPAFGGSTANVEFEALTGLSMSFLKQGSSPYQQVLGYKEQIPSITKYLKEKDYKTLAIHPFEKHFYKRTDVYNNMGFDRFIGQEDMNFNEYFGMYISDESFNNEIIANIKNAKQPTFIHAVSMQNHFPYTQGRFPENQIKVGGLNAESNEILETYSNGIHKTDQAMKKLIDALDNLDEDVILVFWGDHLPSLGENQSVYQSANFANIREKGFVKQYYETPFFIYTNFEYNHSKLGTMSPIYFGPLVFEVAGIKNPPYYEFLSRLKEELPGIHPEFNVDSNGDVIQDLSDEQKKLLEKYELVEYDLLQGKQQSYSGLFK